MRLIILIIGANLLFLYSFGQEINIKATANISIAGKVVDSISKQPIEYAAISLTDISSKKIVNGSISTNKGFFKINNILPGSYSLSIESIGYISYIKKINTAESRLSEIVIAEVLLSKKSGTLQNVTVTGSKQVIENKIDKIVFNVDKDITSQGGMATDALKKIPQVSVDINGNIELLGNPSIRFLINGKPSGMFGNNPAEALQSIPASQIQSIEVITTPGAKYDASGTGGIINIILKKNKVEGLNGNINTAIGTRLENANINISLKKNNIGVNGFFGGNKQLTSNTPITMNRIAVNTGIGSSNFRQQSNADFERDGYKSGVGLDWNLSKKDILTGSLGYNHFANQTKGNYNQLSIQYDLLGSEISNINSIRVAENKVYVNTIDNELSYKRKFNKENQELEITYAGSYSNNNTYYNQSQQYTIADTSFAGSTSLNQGKENETEVGINYIYPVKENILLETGFKTSIESIISNANVFTLNTSLGTYVKDAMQSFQSDFHRQIYAGYASVSFLFSKMFDVKAGVRYEYTENGATYSNAAKTTIPAYSNTAPSIIVSHSFKNNQNIKFAYSYRIERPDFKDLNPFMNLSDPHNISTGNPNLQPEIGQNYQLSYIKTFEKGATINLVLYLQKNSPDIKPYVRYYPTYKIGDSIFRDVTITTRSNIAAELRPGINLSISAPLNKQLNFRSNIQFYNRHLNNIYDSPAVINGFAIRMNMNVAYQFSHSIAAEIFGNYNSGMKWQGRRPSAFSYTMAVRKQFKNNKGSIGFIAVNPFNKYIDQKTLQEAKGFTTDIFQQLPYRSFGISFTYKFGKLKFTKPKENDNYLYTPPIENN
jgi:outer membrane receptor protein involved in Fe transport